jgi:hypothetical protein
MSRQPEGRRGRGRKPDPAEETATWLLEMEQQAHADDQGEDEEWAQQLRSTRASGSTGQFHAVPAEGPGTAPPPSRPSHGDPTGRPAAYPASQPPAHPTSPPAAYPSGQPPAYPPPAQYPAGQQAPPPQFPPAGQYQPGEQQWSGTYPPLEERYRPLGGMPPAPASPPPPPPRARSTDPGATAWAWDQQAPPAEPGYRAGTYQAPPAAWDPGVPSYQRPPAADPQPSRPSWEVDDPASGAAPPAAEPQPWDTAAGSEQWSGNWPFEETTQSWEANDESWRWPTQEVPSSTGSWDVDPAAWGDRWGSGQGQPAAPGGSTAGDYQAGGYQASSDPRPVPNGYPAADSFAAANGYSTNGYPGPTEVAGYGRTGPGGSSGPTEAGPPQAAGPAAAGYGAAATDSAAPAPQAWSAEARSAWYGEEAPRGYQQPSSSTEFPGVLEGDEQVVRLGRSADEPDGGGWGTADSSRIHPGRSTRTGEARRFQPAGEHRPTHPSWPRVVALISWIILLMVVCWFYVFPWLEQILPENF